MRNLRNKYYIYLQLKYMNVYVNFPFPQADKILDHLLLIIKNQQTIMASLDETLAKVTEEGTKDDSLIALFAGLKTQLDEVLSGVVIPPAVQTKVDAIFSGASSNADKVQAAIDANTPPTPPTA